MNSNRYQAPLQFTGDIWYGDRTVSTRELKRSVAYVMQQDYVVPTQTVRESIEFAAMLKLPQTASFDFVQTRVNSLIASLHLESCENTVVGDVLRQGISAGQYKRVCIACEMVTCPKVF